MFMLATLVVGGLCALASATTGQLTSSAAAASEPSDNPYELVVQKIAPAMVTVRFVMAYEGNDHTEEQEIDGLVIDPRGVVLVSSAMMFGPEYLAMPARPRQIRIIPHGQSEALDAEVLVRDRELDLAWLRITAENDEPRNMPFVSFAADASPRLGQPVLQVWMLDRYFDRTPYVSEGRVAAIVAKPRDLFIASGEITIGLPVCDLRGDILGFGVLQLPDEQEMAAMTSTNPYARMMFTRTMLPAARVAAATRQAMALLEDDDR